MGCNMLRRNSSSTVETPANIPRPQGNPNPHNFTVERTLKKGGYWLSLIHYPDCDNFEGQKLIVSRIDPCTAKAFDPHFTSNGYIVARFEPTAMGWNTGVKFLDLL